MCKRTLWFKLVDVWYQGIKRQPGREVAVSAPYAAFSTPYLCWESVAVRGKQRQRSSHGNWFGVEIAGANFWRISCRV